jgi:hypothetical protein
MSAQLEEADIADGTRLLARALLEAVLLRIRDGFETKGQNKDDDRNNVRSLTKGWLRYSENIGAVQDRDWKRDCPDPQHLEHPESEEREELVTLVVEAIVFASLQDSEQ